MTIANLFCLRAPGAGGRFPFTLAACLCLIVLGVVPIVFGFAPWPTMEFFERSPGLQSVGVVSLGLLVVLALLVIYRLDPEQGMGKTLRYCGFVMVALLLTDVHFYTRDIFCMNWQIEQHKNTLLHTEQAPDQYRFLPQGILWWLMLGNGDFAFSYVVYRFFFTFLICHAAYTLGRCYLSPRDAVMVVLLYAAFYPLSTRYYKGNLVDPMSHAVMLAALIYCQRRQFGQVFWLFVLGMLIKETMLVLAPCYYLLNASSFRLRDGPALRRVALLVMVGVALFFACRLPFDFGFSFKALNRTSQLMIYSNLGLPGGMNKTGVSLFQRYMHPILFLFLWLPLIIGRRKWLPPSLFRTALYLAASLYAVNLCFGWNYESRNFVPALIVLLICTLVIVNSLLAESPRNGGQGRAESMHADARG